MGVRVQGRRRWVGPSSWLSGPVPEGWAEPVWLPCTVLTALYGTRNTLSTNHTPQMDKPASALPGTSAIPCGC